MPLETLEEFGGVERIDVELGVVDAGEERVRWNNGIDVRGRCWCEKSLEFLLNQTLALLFFPSGAETHLSLLLLNDQERPDLLGTSEHLMPPDTTQPPLQVPPPRLDKILLKPTFAPSSGCSGKGGNR